MRYFKHITRQAIIVRQPISLRRHYVKPRYVKKGNKSTNKKTILIVFAGKQEDQLTLKQPLKELRVQKEEVLLHEAITVLFVPHLSS